MNFFEKGTIWANSGLTSHDSRGFQLTPNAPEFEIKWYGESYYIPIFPINTLVMTLIYVQHSYDNFRGNCLRENAITNSILTHEKYSK